MQSSVTSDTQQGAEYVHYFSATQIDTFLSCPRKWAWKYIARRSSPQHPSAGLGTLIHQLLENYLKTGETLPLSHVDPEIRNAAEIAAAGIHLLPQPKTPGMTVEGENDGFRFTLKAEDGTPLHIRGVKDISLSRVAGTSGLPEVWDHKSTSDFRWAKTEESLLQDVQANLYAYDAMENARSTAVAMNWIYYLTRGAKKAKRVHLKMSREQVVPHILEMRPLLSIMLTTLLEKRDPLTFPVDAAACGAFGGCPYQADCEGHITTAERAKSMMGQTAMTLLEKLNMRRAEMTGVPVPAAEAAAPPATPTGSLFLRFKTAASVPPPQPALEQVGAGTAINPPGEFQPPPAADAKEEETPAAEEKPKRGRPRGSKNKETVAPIVAETTVNGMTTLAVVGTTLPGIETDTSIETFRAKEPIEEAPRHEALSAWKTGFRLFVDCVPLGADVTHAEQVFVAAKARILVEHGKADYRYIPFHGAAVFQGTLQALIDEGQVVGNVILNSSTPEGQLAMAVMMPAAIQPVVRGMR